MKAMGRSLPRSGPVPISEEQSVSARKVIQAAGVVVPSNDLRLYRCLLLSWGARVCAEFDLIEVSAQLLDQFIVRNVRVRKIAS